MTRSRNGGPPYIRSPLHHVNINGILYKPKVFSYGTSADEDVYRIGNTTKDQQTEMIMEILSSRPNAERQNIVHRYNRIFKKSLLDERENFKSGLMKQLFEDLLTDTSILLADELYTAINASNLQKTTSILIDFWGDEFDQVETAYKINSTESIWKTIEKKFGNSVKSILHCIVETRKYETKQEYPIKGRGGKPIVNNTVVIEVFYDLMNVLDSNNDVGQQLGERLCKLDSFQFQKLNMIYRKKPVRQFGEVLESRTSGQLHDILLAMYNYSINKPMYFATLIHDELHKELIDSLSVQRLFIFRSEIDLHTIDKLYKVIYGIDLSEDVKQKYHGEYGNTLLKLLKKREIPDIFQHSISILPPLVPLIKV
ncbi:hypothetical protein MS3_00008886 [Schistosoma haematobium]|uniref:Annexin n=1 Tax=Schistosoma haematobium TaxID=6185 RepID=A0A922LG59_SCHHA|nr:hypothetical protein MS3_00008886 [Schistosoma haematobium]KAH9581889.1 hypothetical protein MS3_00008886 [Schistosoma haematobium]CAH8612348.1 unnamed protein product [Schistosoma haematobium]CAH8620044.1 unnamed protein product [Schistosoma haematobium]